MSGLNERRWASPETGGAIDNCPTAGVRKLRQLGYDRLHVVLVESTIIGAGVGVFTKEPRVRGRHRSTCQVPRERSDPRVEGLGQIIEDVFVRESHAELPNRDRASHRLDHYGCIAAAEGWRAHDANQMMFLSNRSLSS